MPSKYARRHYTDHAQILADAREEVARLYPAGEDTQPARIAAYRILDHVHAELSRLYRGDNGRFDVDRFDRAARREA